MPAPFIPVSANPETTRLPALQFALGLLVAAALFIAAQPSLSLLVLLATSLAVIADLLTLAALKLPVRFGEGGALLLAMLLRWGCLIAALVLATWYLPAVPELLVFVGTLIGVRLVATGLLACWQPSARYTH